jgi:hypothetical protein
MVVKLWNPDVFDQTREVWSATVLTHILEQMGDSLPVWVAIGEEKRAKNSENMYYPAVTKKFTPNEMNAFSWAQQARDSWRQAWSLLDQ